MAKKSGRAPTSTLLSTSSKFHIIFTLPKNGRNKSLDGEKMQEDVHGVTDGEERRECSGQKQQNNRARIS
jgi:hypothetical protein